MCVEIVNFYIHFYIHFTYIYYFVTLYWIPPLKKVDPPIKLVIPGELEKLYKMSLIVFLGDRLIES